MKLWLDDTRRPPDDTWKWVKTVEEAKATLCVGDVTSASLDHDLGFRAPTGYDFVKWMCETETWPSDGITVHSWNPVGAKNMCAMIDRYGPYNKPATSRECKWYWSPNPDQEQAMEQKLWDQ